MYRKRREIEIADLYIDGETLESAINQLDKCSYNINIIPKDNPLYYGDPYIDISEYYGSTCVRLIQDVYIETEEEFEQRRLEHDQKKESEVEQLKRRLRELGEDL
jgi:hypothetical protein